MESKPEFLTQILAAADQGDPKAADQVWRLVYHELRELALRKIGRLRPGQTLQPTALVHEAYLRLAGNEEIRWESRAHFFGAAARAMRNIIVDHLRMKGRIKHGGGQQRMPISEMTLSAGRRPVDLLALDETLDRLEKHDPRMCEITMLRFFTGLTIEETAKMLKISTSTVEREWSYARSWLYREMKTG
ncbi:MAG: sigma-70 family RNA polymerase sigma factor [Planctomycetota bacterium]